MLLRRQPADQEFSDHVYTPPRQTSSRKEVIWLKKHVQEVIWLKKHVQEVIWLKKHAQEIIWLEKHVH